MTNEAHRHLGLFWGIVITAIGVVFLLDQLEIVHAAYIFDFFWPLILIGFGVALIVKTMDIRMTNTPTPQPVTDDLSQARRTTINFWGPVLILIGVVWLLSNLTHFDAGRLWPLWVIAVGVWLLINKNRPRRHRRRDWRRSGQPPHGWPPSGGPAPGPGATYGPGSGPNPASSGFAERGEWGPAPPIPPNPSPPGFSSAPPAASAVPPTGSSGPAANASASVDDSFEHSIVFMAFKRRITTQHFRYAKLSAVFGGFHLDFTLADMEGSQAVMQIEAVFGGGEIRIPPAWRVTIDAHAFGGAFMDETYARPDATAPSKTLIIRGSTVFGGVVIKN